MISLITLFHVLGGTGGKGKKKMPGKVIHQLVGGFNALEKYRSKWESSPNRGENNESLKPPPSQV